MIALIAHRRKKAESWEGFSPTPEDIFPYWHHYYKNSGTTLPFVIFTDKTRSIKELRSGGEIFKTIPLDTIIGKRFPVWKIYAELFGLKFTGQ